MSKYSKHLNCGDFICKRCTKINNSNYSRTCVDCNSTLCDYCLEPNTNAECIISSADSSKIQARFCPFCVSNIIDKTEFFEVMEKLSPTEFNKLVEEYKEYKELEKIN